MAGERGLLRQGERVADSELIGQPFSRPDYFWERLSATSPFPYNAAASSGSSFGSSHPGLAEAADGLLLEQVFVNLLENAVRYTPAGTQDTIRAAIDGEHLRMASSRPPDLVILDLGPPDLEGQEVLKRLRVLVASLRRRLEDNPAPNHATVSRSRELVTGLPPNDGQTIRRPGWPDLADGPAVRQGQP